MNIIIFLGFVIFIHFLFKILQFNLKKDVLRIRLEFISTAIIIIVNFEIRYILAMFLEKRKNNANITFLLDSLFCICLLVLNFILIKKRLGNSYNNNQIKFENEFSTFISKDISLAIFKEYLIKNNQDSFKYLLFYSECMIFKSMVMFLKNENMKEQLNDNLNPYSDLLSMSSEQKNVFIDSSKSNTFTDVSNIKVEVLNKANQIFRDYFPNKDKSSVLGGVSTTGIIIDFPIDIIEKLEEINLKNFKVDRLENIFDESNEWALEQLQDIYEDFKKDINVYNNLEKILFFCDVFEIAS